MFEKLKEYGLYIILGLLALGALAYAYLNTSNSQKGAQIEEANLDAIVNSMSRSDKLKKANTIAEDLLNANGGKTIGKYKIDDSKVSYVIGENYSNIFDNKKTLDISSDLNDIEEGQLRTVLIAQPSTKVDGEDINIVGLNRDKSISIGEQTVAREDLKELPDELKGYNIGGIGYTTFETEQEAKNFRDTYFPSYEIYEIGETGTFMILTEYNQGGGESNITDKIDVSSNNLLTSTGGTGEEISNMGIIAYYPLMTDYTDHSGNGHDLTKVSEVNFNTNASGVKGMLFGEDGYLKSENKWGFNPTLDSSFTIAWQGYITSNRKVRNRAAAGIITFGIQRKINYNMHDSNWNTIGFEGPSRSNDATVQYTDSEPYTYIGTNYISWVITYDGTTHTYYYYRNGTKIFEVILTNMNTGYNDQSYIGYDTYGLRGTSDSRGTDRFYKGYLRNVYLGNIYWTQDMVNTYDSYKHSNTEINFN